MNNIPQERILGAEVLAWGTSINDDNFENNVWMRSAVFGERMWSAKSVSLPQLVAKIVVLQKSLQNSGIDVAPVTSEFCQHHPEKCWPSDEREEKMI